MPTSPWQIRRAQPHNPPATPRVPNIAGSSSSTTSTSSSSSTGGGSSSPTDVGVLTSSALGAQASGSCSWESENCMTSRCCRREGFQCFKHDDMVAGCSPTCPNGTACEVLGGSQEARVLAPATPSANTSMFCFSVVTPAGHVAAGVQKGYEQELLDMMRARQLGIFSCNASGVYQGKVAKTGDWQSVVNTGIFLSVWQQIKEEGTYKRFDWIVKVDLDAVFLPERLRMHLISLRAPANSAVYLQNIDFHFHFQGALEVISSRAVDIFVNNAQDCATNIGLNGGEDFFTMQCLDALGVAHMTDYSLLYDKYSQGPGWNLFDIDNCTNQGLVAMHPFKAVNSWLGCWKVANGVQVPDDFVSCQGAWDGDACSLNGGVQGHPEQPLGDGIVFKK
mmetsp:Transcript_52415/g.168970  ORF Transcript_52415/g.168970 Transcript_52415/m.168970 type:complete len:392 (+) Transcript_52415:158-1333(+)